MPQEINFLQTVPDRIINLLKDWDENSFFVRFINGDDSDMEISTDDMPCIVVDSLATKAGQGATGQDVIQETIKISLVVNRTTYMDDFDDDTVGWKKKLKLMVEGLDPVTQYYDPTTVFGLLRTNFTLGNSITNQTIEAKYGEVPRRGLDETTGEAHITFNIDRYVITPNKA